MKKFTLLIALLTCFAYAAFAQSGTPLDPVEVPKFENDLPVIKELGLRVDLTQGKVNSLPVKMEETTQDLLGMGFQTRVWGYRFPGLPTTYPGATIVAMKDKPIEIKWKNKLPGHFLPVDPTMHMAHPPDMHEVNDIREWYAKGNVPTVAHLHGGHTESDSDGLPEAWFTQNNETGAFFVKKDYWYDNDQQAATLWYHDHALGITRLNVYAGLAGFYLLRDENENNLINGGVLPSGDQEIEIVIQDRMFDTEGQLFWPAYPGDPFYDDFITGELPPGETLPEEDFPGGGPTALAEFFGDIILVNGKAWPKLEVEPRKYRFRLLNGSDSRFYILELENEYPFMVIGTDNGLLHQPVLVTDLVFAPGERYDVVIDFAGMDGEDITMLNFGPDAPFGGTDIPDEELADPLTTGQIMQFQVRVPDDWPNDFEDVSIDGSSVLNAPATISEDVDVTRQLVLFEGKDEYGRLQPLLGTLEHGSLTWFEAITENPAVGATEVWEVYNATGDAHPVHLHLVTFEIMGKFEYTGDVTPRPQIQHNGEYGIGFDLSNVVVGAQVPLRPYEYGWKDTFIVPPGQVGRVKATFDRAGRYVWHCHILSHEDHEMMRPFHVGPIPPPPNNGGKKGAAVVDQEVPEWSGEFKIFPNPISDLAIIEFGLESDAGATLNIYNLDGRLVKSEDLGSRSKGYNTHTLSTDQLGGGVYLLELRAGDKLIRERIFISK